MLTVTCSFFVSNLHLFEGKEEIYTYIFLFLFFASLVCFILISFLFTTFFRLMFGLRFLTMLQFSLLVDFFFLKKRGVRVRIGYVVF